MALPHLMGAILGLCALLTASISQAGLITSMRQLPGFDQGFLDLALTSPNFASGFHTQFRSPISLMDALTLHLPPEAVVKLIGNDSRTQVSPGPDPITPDPIPPPLPDLGPQMISSVPLLPPPLVMVNNTPMSSPVPEPASLALWASVGAALCARGAFRRRGLFAR